MFKKFINRILPFVGALALVGCQQVSEMALSPLAEVGGEKLYLADVPGLSAEGLSAEDSVKIIDKYIRVWATDKLFFQEAEKNVGSSEELEELIERYRRSLLIYEYQLQMVQNVNQDKLPESEVQAYFDKHQDQFLASEPLFRGCYIWVSTKSPDMEAFRMLSKSLDEGNLEILESLCIKNAAKFENFNEKWMPLSEIRKGVPINLNVQMMMRSQALYETRDSSMTFLAYINEYRKAGEAQPFAYAESRVRSMISERRKTAIIKKYEKDLYNNALNSGELKIFKK
ncbi:MAG: hypothetical protein MJZ28_00890 [Paludibacteraceae bacterium]|nr:hypothetical protein [Paludibacteraceae bacterium]